MGRHSAPDQPGDTKTTRGEPRRAPKPGERTPRRPAYKRVPVEVLRPMSPTSTRTREVPTVRPSRSVGRAAVPTPRGGGEPRPSRAAVLAGEGRDYAHRAAIRHAAGGKPSIAGRAAGGAAAGAATGAALGTVVPGIGNAVGAGAGAVLGGAGGAVSGAKAKRAYRQALRADSAGPRKLLLAEFTLCAVITSLSPLTDRKRDEKPGDWMKHMTAVLGLFFLLGLISAGGRGPAKMAAGLGGLITVVLAVGQRDLFVHLAKTFNTPAPPGQVGSGAGAAVGEAAAAGATEVI